ncbi:TIR domain-containing protein [Variovorax sp. J22R115]|uniref:TIR domain-containing protein n=1 Tax=Variovorax sp. J22R115 TaxID=3053509 RepID=UPI002577502E|nr:TIR domain-containing protein [Variovorax sp. J22R115]MDM0052987.1 TIR domain-containing protein [Variovorax sp. J22R115]
MTLAMEREIFVSYAHADNGIALGSSTQFGWVTALVSNLNEGPNVLKKEFFIDHQLRPGDDFGVDLLTRIERSSLLVLLLSQNYVESAWCGMELDHFIRTHANDPDKPADVYVVELVPYEKLNNIPPGIQRIRKRLISSKFWHQPPNTAAYFLAGYPSPTQSGPAGDVHYWSVLNDLRSALDERLRTLRSGIAAVAASAAGPPEEAHRVPSNSREHVGTVLLADTTDDLDAQRTAVRVALEPEGIVVLPVGDYVGLVPQEFDAAFAADLAQADLFVQLLSPTVGRKGKGFDAPLPQLQFQRARSAQRPIMQWCERLPAAGQITDVAHAALFETELIRATNLASFKTAIVDRLHAAIEARRRATAPAEPVSRSARRLVFVDDLSGEPILSDRLRGIMKEQNCTARSLPANTALANHEFDIKEFLRPCRAGITIYTDRTRNASAHRLIYFLNQLAEGELAMTRWGVYLQRGTVESEFGFISDEIVPLDENGLAEFLRGL